MRPIHNLLFFLFSTLIVACNSEKEEENRLDFSTIENKFKYENLDHFYIDTIDWVKRKEMYAILDSNTFYHVYQDTSIKYTETDPDGVDCNFFYSKQNSPRNLIEFTVLSQSESDYCDHISYNIYDLKGKLISSFIVARQCGDGGYYEVSSGKFLNDSTYEFLSEDNYNSEDSENADLNTHSKIITVIHDNGTITQSKSEKIN